MVIRTLEFGRSGGNRPIPIAVLIQAANAFGCEIYIRTDKCRVNVKNYEEMQRLWCSKKGSTEFCFNGEDEKEAEVKFLQIAGTLAP